MSLTLPNKFELSFKQKVTGSNIISRFGIVPVANTGQSNPQYSVYCQQTTTKYVGVYRDSSTHGVGSDTSVTGTDYHNWKIVRDGNTWKWYFEDTQINSDVTLSWFDTYSPRLVGWQYYNNGTCYVKDIIIKPL